MSRNIVPNEGGESFTVDQHIILKNFWEYYLEKPDANGIAFGYVMGFANEWGNVSMEEIQPHVVSRAQGAKLAEVMPPEGYYWEDE
jgi:hypothetical protein